MSVLSPDTAPGLKEVDEIDFTTDLFLHHGTAGAYPLGLDGAVLCQLYVTRAPDPECRGRTLESRYAVVFGIPVDGACDKATGSRTIKVQPLTPEQRAKVRPLIERTLQVPLLIW